MKLQRLEGQLYWIPDSAQSRINQVAAGPFATSEAALWWAVERAEQRLEGSAQPRELWGECLERAGGARADPAQLLGVLTFMRHGCSRKKLLLYSGRL